MVRRAIDDRLPFRWVTADAGYGYSKGWRYELEQADVSHLLATVLAMAAHTYLTTVRARHRAGHPQSGPGGPACQA